MHHTVTGSQESGIPLEMLNSTGCLKDFRFSASYLHCKSPVPSRLPGTPTGCLKDLLFSALYLH